MVRRTISPHDWPREEQQRGMKSEFEWVNELVHLNTKIVPSRPEKIHTLNSQNRRDVGSLEGTWRRFSTSRWSPQPFRPICVPAAVAVNKRPNGWRMRWNKKKEKKRKKKKKRKRRPTVASSDAKSRREWRIQKRLHWFTLRKLLYPANHFDIEDTNHAFVDWWWSA